MTQSQSARLIEYLRGGWRTTGDMLRTGISVCPWKRISESGQQHMRGDEFVKKIRGPDGRMLYRVRRIR